ncbi:hydroxyphenylacetyl-CoA thioesterase PaaI [Taibaiella koreensis]|uniref:hydroxyphenylacetyl-CoA thioesterase PaaI n=1 Tax=Taibaiella koreensis TaxID=1268548 RepID=UPI000E59B675|nr:hydroxyphenylacetyl-CoA thioesterase PaaI [Taibaiella koreensis]
MESHLTPQEVLDIMIARDRFTAWLGLNIDEVGEGYCRLHYQVKEDMLNGFERIHGGVLFSASDSAFAFACNSHGLITVALDVSITFTRPAVAGDKLFVEAREVHLGNKTGLYDIRTTNEKGELVCLFKGTAYRTSVKVTPGPINR